MVKKKEDTTEEAVKEPEQEIIKAKEEAVVEAAELKIITKKVKKEELRKIQDEGRLIGVGACVDGFYEAKYKG